MTENKTIKVYYDSFIEYMNSYGNKMIPFKINELIEINDNKIILKPTSNTCIGIKGKLQSKENLGYHTYFKLYDTQGNELNSNESISIEKVKSDSHYRFDFNFEYLQFRQEFEWIEGIELNSIRGDSLVFTFDSHIKINKDRSEVIFELDLWKLSERYIDSYKKFNRIYV